MHDDYTIVMNMLDHLVGAQEEYENINDEFVQGMANSIYEALNDLMAELEEVSDDVYSLDNSF